MARSSGTNQVDVFATTVLAALPVSLIATLCILEYNLLELVYFIAIWSAIFLLLNRALVPKKRIETKGKAVLVTGCDRGFGEQFAETLSSAGFLVFAGCRDGESNARIRQSLHRMQMDVTKPDEVQKAVDYVKENLNGNVLWGVVNNAGISKGSDIEVTPMSKIQEVLDVNLLGPILVTKAFLPLLEESKGRIVNVASAAGKLLLPGFLPYSISKCALIAFSDGLRLELKHYGIQVISIEPWAYRTKLSEIDSISREIVECDWSKTSGKMPGQLKAQKAARSLFTWAVSDNLDEVSEAVLEAVTSDTAPYRYSPGKWYLNWMMILLQYVPKPLVDFVFCHVLNR